MIRALGIAAGVGLVVATAPWQIAVVFVGLVVVPVVLFVVDMVLT